MERLSIIITVINIVPKIIIPHFIISSVSSLSVFSNNCTSVASHVISRNDKYPTPNTIPKDIISNRISPIFFPIVTVFSINFRIFNFICSLLSSGLLPLSVLQVVELPVGV